MSNNRVRIKGIGIYTGRHYFESLKCPSLERAKQIVAKRNYDKLEAHYRDKEGNLTKIWQ